MVHRRRPIRRLCDSRERRPTNAVRAINRGIEKDFIHILELEFSSYSTRTSSVSTSSQKEDKYEDYRGI